MTAARSSGCPGRFLRPIRPRFFLFRFSGAPAAFHPRFSFPLFRGAGHLLTVPPPPPAAVFFCLHSRGKCCIICHGLSCGLSHPFLPSRTETVSAGADFLAACFGRLRKSAVKVSKKAKNKTARVPVRRRSARVRTDPLSAWPDALFR